MSETVKLPRIKGVALYPCIDREATYQNKPNGRYELQVAYEGAALKAMQEAIDEFLVDTYGPKKAKTIKSPFKDRDGKAVLKFSSYAKDKDGNPKKPIPLFDSKGNPVKRKIRLGTGSIVIPYGSMQEKKTEPGVTFWLSAVQIVKLVEYVPSTSVEAVDDEEGWVDDEFNADDDAPQGSSFADDDIPF